MTEDPRLREQVDRLIATRTWLMRVEMNSNGSFGWLEDPATPYVWPVS